MVTKQAAIVAINATIDALEDARSALDMTQNVDGLDTRRALWRAYRALRELVAQVAPMAPE